MGYKEGIVDKMGDYQIDSGKEVMISFFILYRLRKIVSFRNFEIRKASERYRELQQWRSKE